MIKTLNFLYLFSKPLSINNDKENSKENISQSQQATTATTTANVVA
ncbi:8380_t:CDS:2, partial [Entrophospora sp. SA101]